MDTPSSNRRVTRSQTLVSATNNIPMSRKIEDSEKGVPKSRQRKVSQQDRSVLIDITNDSPIVGLAVGSLSTPSSAMSKKKSNTQPKINTPGSGEALLRGQVKTLLQKVEEEALVDSSIGLLAPTPIGTAFDLNLCGDKEASKKIGLPAPIQENFKTSRVVTEISDGNGPNGQEGPESEKSFITRSLLLDFSEKSEGCDSSGRSALMESESGKGGKSNTEDDNASVWSIQVNASMRDNEEEDEQDIGEIVEAEDDEYDDYEEEEEYDGWFVDELCEGLSKISVHGEEKKAEFCGKHTRFVYNSDDEPEGEEEVSVAVSPSILRLRGLPTPKGKHLRFPEVVEGEGE